jgi:flagella synthesis protein FlgN
MSGYRPAPEFDVGTLKAEIAGYRSLLAVLHREQDALRRADADALPAISEAKQREVQALLRYSSARVRALAAAGRTPSRAAAQAQLIDGGADPAAVERAWNEIEALAIEARQANAVNGALIASQQTYFGRALSALSSAAGTPATYGADGRPQFGLASRSLAAI